MYYRHEAKPETFSINKASKWIILSVTDVATRKRNTNVSNLNVNGRQKKTYMSGIVRGTLYSILKSPTFYAKFNDFGSFGWMYSQMVLFAKFWFFYSQKVLSIYSLFTNLFVLGLISFGISSCETYINLMNFSLNSFSLWRMNTLRLNVYLHSFRSLKRPILQTFRRSEN